MKKPYVKPRVTYAEQAEARAADCARTDIATCEGGPVQS